MTKRVALDSPCAKGHVGKRYLTKRGKTCCRECERERCAVYYSKNAEKIIERSRAYKAAYYSKNAETQYFIRIKRKYNLDRRTLEALLVSQEGQCCCGVPLKLGTRAQGGTADVDHDHSCCPGATSCGKCVRGLLCRSCNNVFKERVTPVILYSDAQTLDSRARIQYARAVYLESFQLSQAS